jgi:hypothetical protein
MKKSLIKLNKIYQIVSKHRRFERLKNTIKLFETLLSVPEKTPITFDSSESIYVVDENTYQKGNGYLFNLICLKSLSDAFMCVFMNSEDSKHVRMVVISRGKNNGKMFVSHNIYVTEKNVISKIFEIMPLF